jgi:hypothetical protein
MCGITTKKNGKNTMTLQVIKDVILRSLALFISFALPSVGVGAFAGVEPVKAAAIAGGLAVAGVVTDLAKAFLKDGELSQDEVDEVFKKASKGKGGK